MQARVHLTAKEKPSSPATPPTWYTVAPGDTLSSIAGRFYHNAAAWPVLFWRNHAQVHWADIIKIGEVLRVPAEPSQIPAAPGQLGPPAPAPVVHTTADFTPRHAAPAPQEQAPDPAPASSGSGGSGSWSGGTPGGSFGACVVARESGGNPQVMNSTGHYGLYQFSASTWAAYGGNPGDFGHASVAEQNQVFANALARGGQDNWAPYDGC